MTTPTTIDRPQAAFPYDDVLATVQQVGKHFMPADLLDHLATVRAQLYLDAEPDPVLGRWLDCLLDKYDHRYDYRSYLALPMLPLPRAGGDPGRRRDELLLWLLTDLIQFELDTAAGQDTVLPGRRPSAALADKRIRLARRALAGPARRVLNVADTDDLGAGPDVATAAASWFTEEQLRGLRLSMLPVATVHDEWMFIRVLQSYETVFTDLALSLRTAIGHLDALAGDLAAGQLHAAADTLDEAAPLFSLLATMQPESFHEFRTYTTGASAIQSDAAKAVESLCATPSAQRLNSPAYQSVPTIRGLVLAGQRTVNLALTEALAAGLPAVTAAAVRRGMDAFSASLTRWRATHYKLAKRMLGEQRTGTGYTEGVPYLDRMRREPVFGPQAARPEPDDELTWSGESH
ncbi:MAG: hypothetical protein HOV87_11910 [Catenulispora sp.]|nr:hypothetical protein [Catenulispora sp.]NUT40045.1 hypothetical protein [Thermoactinospora sp.]